MEVSISFAAAVTDEDASALDELSAALSQDGIANQPVKSHVEPGQKGGLTTGIAVTKLVLSSIGTLVSVLNFWQKTRPKYKITINRGDIKIEVDNLSAASLREAINSINGAVGDTQTKILIASK